MSSTVTSGLRTVPLASNPDVTALRSSARLSPAAFASPRKGRETLPSMLTVTRRR